MSSQSAEMAVDLPEGGFVETVTIPIDDKLLALYESVFTQKGLKIDKGGKDDLDRSLGGR